MKPSYQKGFGLHGRLIFFCITILLLQSCDTYNFSQPQPVDKENLEEFPVDFRGKWISENDNELVWFGKRDFLMVNNEGKGKVVMGGWPRLNAKGELVADPFYNGGLQTIHYDSLKKPIDTVNNYFIGKKLIYHVNAEGLLDNGYPFKMDKDTIIVMESDTTRIDLGHNAFLRKLKKNFYVFNISNAIIEGYFNNESSNWWQLFILEKRSNDQINIWVWTSKLYREPSMFYNHDDTYYFDSQWTTNDFMQLIQTGVLKDGGKLTSVKEEANK